MATTRSNHFNPTEQTVTPPDQASARLQTALRVGAIHAPNRVFMAPMTRARGTRDHVPTPLMATYYAQRASAGLILSEAIGISPQGLGWPYATGLWSAEQAVGWRHVTDAVHQAGGRIVAQLWHMGRTVHPAFMNGLPPVSASATTAPGHAHTYEGRQMHVQARALSAHELQAIVQDYATAARQAIAAGFDGVQIHAANGYLIDQFLRSSANLRDDRYGGSISNRTRLLVEVVQAVSDAVGADRTGVRLSPNGTVEGVSDADPLPLFRLALQRLSALGIAHVELREPPQDGSFGVGDMPPLAPQLRASFDGVLIVNSDYDGVRAEQALRDGIADAVSFGRPFVANPDYAQRLANGLPLAPDQPGAWFTQDGAGYTDYPPHPFTVGSAE